MNAALIASEIIAEIRRKDTRRFFTVHLKLLEGVRFRLKPILWPIPILHLWFKDAITTMDGEILLPRNFEDPKAWPQTVKEAVFIHESKHIAQRRAKIFTSTSYLMNKSLRMRVELEAEAEETFWRAYTGMLSKHQIDSYAMEMVEKWPDQYRFRDLKNGQEWFTTFKQMAFDAFSRLR